MNRKLLNLGCGGRYHPDWVNVDIGSNDPNVKSHDLREKLPFEDEVFDVVYHSHVLEHLPKACVPMFLHECYRVLKPGGIIRLVVPDLEQITRLYLEMLDRACAGDADAVPRYDWILLEMFDQMVRSESGGEMRKYWMQDPMPAEDFVIARVGSEATEVIRHVRHSKSADGSNGRITAFDDDYEAIGKFRLSGEVHQWMYDRYSSQALLKSAGFERIRQCGADESSIPGFNAYLLDIERDGSIRKPDSLFMEAMKPLHESEADRAERLDRVRRLDAQLQEGKAGRSENKGLIHVLEARLKESETDRAARLGVIHQLHDQLLAAEAGRAEMTEAFYKTKAQLKTSEEDRAARLELTKRMEVWLQERESQLRETEGRLRASESSRVARENEIINIKGSLSWRITTPLRWIGRLFRK